MSLIGALKGVANTAVGLAPYAQQAMLAQKQRDDADKQRMLAQLHQMSQDSTASVNATAAYGLNAAQQAHLGAQTDALRHPPTSLTYRMNENGEYEGMPTKLGGAPSAPNPLTAGPKVIGDGSEPQQPTQQPGITPIATGVKGAQKAPLPGSPGWLKAQTDLAKVRAQFRPAPQPSYTPFQGTDASGQPVVRPFNTKTGQFGPVADVAPKLPAGAAAGSTLAAPMAAKVGQAGEMLKKASDLLPMMEALPVSLGQSASADIAQNGVGVGHARIPGTKGLGNVMLNANAGYAQYQAAISPFVLAAAHALSGARINQDQVNQIRQSIELAPGDLKNPQVVQQKRKNLLDLVNSITGSLPADAIGAQEGQIDPESLRRLEGYGYRRAAHGGGRAGPAPATAPHAPNPDDHPGTINLGGGTDPESAWAAKNPPKKGETFDAYHARYLKSGGGGDE